MSGLFTRRLKGFIIERVNSRGEKYCELASETACCESGSGGSGSGSGSTPQDYTPTPGNSCNNAGEAPVAGSGGTYAITTDQWFQLSGIEAGQTYRIIISGDPVVRFYWYDDLTGDGITCGFLSSQIEHQNIQVTTEQCFEKIADVYPMYVRIVAEGTSQFYTIRFETGACPP